MISRKNKLLLLAVEKGYRVDKNGILFKNDKKKLNNYKTIDGYFLFPIRDGKRMGQVKVHRLQAYQKFGEIIFRKDILCRHANNISTDNSWDNILIGSAFDNTMDMPKDKRIERSIKGGLKVRKFTDNEVEEIKKDRINGMKYKQLCEKYKTCKSTLYYLFKKGYYNKTKQ